jgi:lysophospholipase L1-like esterase
MLQIARTTVTSYFDYCFIYGGANDMAGNRSYQPAVDNIQSIVNLCVKHNVTPIVVVGFDASKCITSTAPKYAGYSKRYSNYQQQLIEQLSNCIVVDTRDLVEPSDCADGIGHMKLSGHQKMANGLIEKLQIKRL